MKGENLPEASLRYDKSYSEIKEKISDFARTDKKSGLAVELVTITGLCAINWRFIQMEVAAKSNGFFN